MGPCPLLTNEFGGCACPYGSQVSSIVELWNMCVRHAICAVFQHTYKRLYKHCPHLIFRSYADITTLQRVSALSNLHGTTTSANDIIEVPESGPNTLNWAYTGALAYSGYETTFVNYYHIDHRADGFIIRHSI